MKIELHNFGPIHYYEFDLDKDLHLIYGENNVGKSYAISAVYLILKGLNKFFDLTTMNFSELGMLLETALKDIEPIKPTDDFLQKRKKNIERLITNILNHALIPILKESFDSSFPINDFQNKLSLSGFYIFINLTKIKFNIEYKANFYIKDVELSQEIGIPDFSLNSNDKSVQIGEVIGVLLLFLNSLFVDVKTIKSFYFIPASPFGIYQALNTFSPLMAQLSQKRNLLSNQKIQLPNISEPISDYFLNLSTIKSKNISISKIRKIFQSVENEILEGEIRFDEDSKKIKFYQHDIKTEFELSHVSSMVAQISLLIAHFKYLLDIKIQGIKSTIFFIEEPEAHLHPKIQVKLMEIFAELSQHGVKVVMTTHSNYMFNKLGNLLLEGKISPDKVSSCLMKMTKKGSVADYEVMKAEADGMNDENFADVAEQLYNERLELYDKLNQKANAH